MWNFKSLQKPLAILSMLCLFSLGAMAQGAVKGTVIDEAGEAVIGASVQVQGAKTGAVTDFNGNFSVQAANNATLIISYVGYVTETVSVQGRSDIQVTLKEDITTLNDVVVIGYGVQKKKLVTGATVQVKGDDIAKLNTTNALEAMQSSTPGVQITSSSTQPGKGYKVYIRGMGTIGDAQPLYVIDGVAGGNLDGINPNDIESIDVLKDAASAAIYGSRAANGVILVTTKQGKAGKIEITYNGAFGWSNAYKRPQMLNAQQFMTIMDEYSFNTSGQKVNFTDYIPVNILNKVANGWEGTDWWKEFENKNALQQNHSVTLTGGTDRSKFAMSYTYTGNEGIMGADVASYYKRHTIRINSDHVLLKAKDFDAITIGENISIGYSRNHDLAEDGMYWSYIHSLLQTSPLVPMYADNGELYNHVNYGAGWNDYWFNNPYEGLSKGGFNSMAESRNINTSATALLTIQPIKGLRLRSQFNYNWGSGAYRNFGEPRSPSAGSGTVTAYSVSQSAWLSTNWSVENTLTYIYGEDPVAQPPFKPAAWNAACMRFSDNEGKFTDINGNEGFLPYLSDEVYWGLKTLIFDISDATPDCAGRIMNGWWSARYDDNKDVSFTNGLWELQLTEAIAKDCARGNGGDGKDLDLMITSGSCQINAIYYEE